MKKSKIKKIMKETCFGSLAFCCDKECPVRNEVIRELGLSLKDFIKLKKQFDKNLFEVLKNV